MNYVIVLMIADRSRQGLPNREIIKNDTTKVLAFSRKAVFVWYFFIWRRQGMEKLSIKNLVLSGLFLALGLVMPFLTGQIPNIGSRLLPMHIPVLLCGFISGWQYGLIVGLIVPLFRSLLFGMPPMLPTAMAMAFELATYGCIAGLLYKVTAKKNTNIYLTLIISMICGRIAWGMVSLFLYGLSGTPFTWKLFITSAFLNAIPGIVIQLVIIPIIIIALERAKLIENV
jgi:thiamine transporter ThiT